MGRHGWRTGTDDWARGTIGVLAVALLLPMSAAPSAVAAPPPPPVRTQVHDPGCMAAAGWRHGWTVTLCRRSELPGDRGQVVERRDGNGALQWRVEVDRGGYTHLQVTDDRVILAGTRTRMTTEGPRTPRAVWLRLAWDSGERMRLRGFAPGWDEVVVAGMAVSSQPRCLPRCSRAPAQVVLAVNGVEAGKRRGALIGWSVKGPTSWDRPRFSPRPVGDIASKGTGFAVLVGTRRSTRLQGISNEGRTTWTTGAAYAQTVDSMLKPLDLPGRIITSGTKPNGRAWLAATHRDGKPMWRTRIREGAPIPGGLSQRSDGDILTVTSAFTAHTIGAQPRLNSYTRKGRLAWSTPIGGPVGLTPMPWDAPTLTAVGPHVVTLTGWGDDIVGPWVSQVDRFELD